MATSQEAARSDARLYRFQSIGVTKEWRPCWHCVGLESYCVGLGFQSIGVTKEWRPRSTLVELAEEGRCFQSIGVTKEWRQRMFKLLNEVYSYGFQSIGVTKEWRRARQASGRRHRRLAGFPINRRHQRMATAAELRLRRAGLIVSNQ